MKSSCFVGLFRVQKALSFSVALFSSVCLASRLSTSFHTFSLVTSAVLVFALWPELRKYIKVFQSNNSTNVLFFSSSYLAIKFSNIFIINNWTYDRMCDTFISSFDTSYDSLCISNSFSYISMSDMACFITKI